MAREIIMSIQSDPYHEIVWGRKRREFRTSVAKGFVGWINLYLTQARPYLFWSVHGFLEKAHTKRRHHDDLNGKVVARFWYDEHDVITQANNVYNELLENQIKIITKEGIILPKEEADYLSKLCLTPKEVIQRLNKRGVGYALHIKELEIFAKPKELKDFHIYNKNQEDNIGFQITGDKGLEYLHTLTRAPQSWQYVYTEGQE